MPRLSIVSATKNALLALQNTAASLAIQTSRDFEHIVVDGASEDGTPDWLASEGSIRWISEPDEGIADALSKGFRLASGDFVLVLQAGDTLVGPEVVEDALRYTDAVQPADVIAFDIMFGDTRRVGQSRPGLRVEWKPLHHQGVLFRRSLFDRVGPFDPSYRICMDYDLLLRAKRAGAKFRGVRYLISRMDPDGISSRRDWPSLRARFAEERRTHFANGGPIASYLYSLYWPLYLRYRKLKASRSRDHGD